MKPTPLRSFRRALTLTELLVVILIIAALLAVAVPAFSSMLYSSESAMAESQVQGAMRAGRDAALRASGRDDAAVVFAYNPAPGGGRLVMIPCVHLTIDFHDNAALTGPPEPRDVFVPSASIESVQLPRHWMIRGYAPANSISSSGIWYEGMRYGQSTTGHGDWVFPETGFYIPNAANEGRFRQTFMVRFVAGSGVIATQTGAPALVFLPTQTDPPGFTGLPAGELGELRALRLADPRRYVQRVITSTTITAAMKRNLLNSTSPDMVTVEPVSAVALYDETRLAAGLRARLDPDTGCLYKAHLMGQDPTFVPVADASGSMTDDDAQTGLLMNQWIEGDTDLVNGVRSRQDGDAPQARIFLIDRHSGALQRVETQE